MIKKAYKCAFKKNCQLSKEHIHHAISQLLPFFDGHFFRPGFGSGSTDPQLSLDRKFGSGFRETSVADQ
jgi:hypothetical protein